MPTVTKSIQDQVKRIDKNLVFIWNQKIQRWDLVRFIEGAIGKYVWVMTVQNADGSYREPDNRVIEYLKTYDLANWRGDTPQKKMENFLRWKNRHNQEVKERARREGLSERFDRFQEYREAARRFGNDLDSIKRHVRKDSERMKEYDATRTEKNRILRGVDPVSP